MRTYTVAAALLCTTTLASFCATAQQAPTNKPATRSKASNKLEEIVVTATRRSENLQKAPVAVTALSATQLTQRGLQTSLDLQQATPGLTYSDNANFSEPYIRGVGTDITTPGAESSVATYVDGVYQASPYFGVQSLTEVDRVEVLKGPQGTLYGRNATGGVINVITKDPPTRFAADATVSAGNYGSSDDTLYVGGPLTNTLFANLAVAEDRHDGYGKSLNTGEGIDFLDRQYVRAKILYKPSEDFSYLVSGQYLNSYDTSNAYTYLTKFGAKPLAPLLGGKVTYDSYDVYSAYPFKDDTQAAQVSGKGIYDFGPFKVTSVTAYTNLNARIFPDFVSSNVPIFNFDANTDKDETIQQDVFASGTNYGLQWTTGFSYLHDTAEFDPIYTFTGSKPTASVYATVKTDSYAGFVDLHYKITDLFSVFAGIRYDTDTKEQARLDFGNGVGAVLATTPPSQKTYDDTTYRAGVQYTPTWGLVYAKYETGFKAGSVNAEAPGDYIAPEKIKSYELGLKTEAFDNRVRLNAEGFYYDYTNLQTQYTDITTGAAYYESAKSATVYGGEINLDVVATDSLVLSSGLSLLHTKFDDFVSNGSYKAIGGFDVATPNLNLAGNNLTHSPPVSFNFDANYHLPFADGSALVLNGNLYYSAKYYFDVTNRISQDSYETLNARVQWNLADGHTQIAFWGRNLTEAKYLATASASPFGDAAELAPPLTFGFTASYRY